MEHQFFFLTKLYTEVNISSVQSLSRVRLFATPWTVAHQTPLSMGFSRQEYWSGLPCPPPGDLPNPGIKPRSPSLQADSLPSEPPGKPMSTGVGSLSLLQVIFPTQESSWDLLHCRSLCQLSYHLVAVHYATSKALLPVSTHSALHIPTACLSGW